MFGVISVGKVSLTKTVHDPQFGFDCVLVNSLPAMLIWALSDFISKRLIFSLIGGSLLSALDLLCSTPK